MQKNFEGVRVDAQYGIYQHKNDNPVADVVQAAQNNAVVKEFFALPKENVRDGESTEELRGRRKQVGFPAEGDAQDVEQSSECLVLSNAI